MPMLEIPQILNATTADLPESGAPALYTDDWMRPCIATPDGKIWLLPLIDYYLMGELPDPPE